MAQVGSFLAHPVGYIRDRR